MTDAPRSPRSVPFSEEAEDDLLGAILTPSREALLAAFDHDLTPDDFYVHRNRIIYKAILKVYEDGIPINAVTVADRAATEKITKDSLVAFAARALPSHHADGYARVVAEKAFLRRGIAYGEDVVTTGYAADVDKMRDLADAATIQLASPLEHVAGEELDDLLEDEAVEDEKPWIIPGILRKRERVGVTGGEGAGKSTVFRQTAMCCASGIHPFTALSANMPTSSVLVVDLQEDRADIKLAFRGLRDRARDLYVPGMLNVLSRPQGMNLLAATDQRWLEALIAHHRPDLLMIGPVRKLYRQTGKYGKSTEEATDELTRILDDLRIAYGFALMLEMHAGHDREDWRPRGSSVWLDWPEFGLGLSLEVEEPREFAVKRWRVDRHSGRAWPRRLLAGPGWPWQVGPADHERMVRAMGLDYLIDGAEGLGLPVE